MIGERLAECATRRSPKLEGEFNANSSPVSIFPARRDRPIEHRAKPIRGSDLIGLTALPRPHNHRLICQRLYILCARLQNKVFEARVVVGERHMRRSPVHARHVVEVAYNKASWRAQRSIIGPVSDRLQLLSEARRSFVMKSVYRSRSSALNVSYTRPRGPYK